MAEIIQLIPIVPNLPWPESLEWFRGQTTARLKQMWDDDRFHVHCDEIYFAMQERGEGRYVAV